MVEWVISCFAPDHVRNIKYDKIFLEMQGNGIELHGVCEHSESDYNDGFYLGIGMLSPFQSHLIKLPVIRLMDV